MDTGPHHSFDWGGFSFTLKSLALLSFIALSGYSVWFFLAHWQSSGAEPAHAAFLGITVPAARAPEARFSTTTPVRSIEHLTIGDAIPATGKFIAADLTHMELALYQDGQKMEAFPILTIGRPGSPYETPSGFYEVLAKAGDVYNAGEAVHMPYALEFYGNYFIHGWPYFADGTPVASSYSGGCIRLATADAAKVYQFADTHTPLFVYEEPATTTTPAALAKVPTPKVSAEAYLVADLDNGAVYLEKGAEAPRPIASVTKLMTALVANETIMFDRELSIPRADLLHSTSTAVMGTESFTVDELLYPLLMESNNAIADDLGAYYGTKGFVNWMNAEAEALGMTSTSYADPSGVSKENISTPDDLFRLARYEADRKSFIFTISRTPLKTLTGGGRTYQFANFNLFSDNPDFIGGKVGQTVAAGDTMVSLFTVHGGDLARRVAIIILKSGDYNADTRALLAWLNASVHAPQSACVTCAPSKPYRTIDY